MSRRRRDPYSIFDTPTADKHIANLGLFVRLQVPWSKPTSGVESGFVVDASRVASVPHLLFGELAAGGRELLRRTDDWEKWLRACGDSEVSDSDDAFARPEEVEYGEAAVKNNKAVALLLEGNPRRARDELVTSLQLQRRNSQQPWGASRPAAELEQQVTLLNLAATEAMLGEYDASGHRAESVVETLQDEFPKQNATVGTLMAIAAFYSGCAQLGAKWSDSSLQTERVVAARAAAASFRSAALMSRQWAGAKGDIAKKIGTARRKLDRKLTGTWQESKGAGNAAATHELYALGMPPVSVSAALSASSLPERRRSAGGMSSTFEPSSVGLSTTGQSWASGSLPSLGFGAVERAMHALEHRDALARRAQRRAHTRQATRHQVTVELPLNYSTSQWKKACKTAASELMRTGLRFEQVDLSFNTDPLEPQHTWAVVWQPQRQDLSHKREAQLRSAVMGALKTDWRKRMGTYKEKEKPPEMAPTSSSDEDDEDVAATRVPGLSAGAPAQAKSFRQMEKDLRKRLAAASPEELSKLFFTAMVAEDQDMIRRLLALEQLDIEKKNVKGETATDVARDRGKVKSLEVIEGWRQRQNRKKNGRGGKPPGELSTTHLNLSCSPEIEEEIRAVFKQFDRDGDGTMDLEELSTVFVSLGAELKDRELQKVMNEMDMDNTGSIDFDEFAVVMAKRLPKLKR